MVAIEECILFGAFIVMCKKSSAFITLENKVSSLLLHHVVFFIYTEKTHWSINIRSLESCGNARKIRIKIQPHHR
jgi:hypothetical protein